MSENEGNAALNVECFLAGLSKTLVSCFSAKGGDQSWEVGKCYFLYIVSVNMMIVESAA